MKDYSECKLKDQGNVFQWDQALSKLQIEKLNVVDVDQKSICPTGSSQYYIAIGEGKHGIRTFDDAVELCENIGGELAVVANQSIVNSLTKELGGDEYSTWIGFTDRLEVGSQSITTGCPKKRGNKETRP